MVLLIIFKPLESNSQGYNGKALYKIKLAEDALIFKGSLMFDNKHSIFKWKQKDTSRWFVEEDPKDEFSTFQVVLTDTTGHAVLRNYDEVQVKVRSFCQQGKANIYFDTLEFKWFITNETQTIKGLNCIKATSSFRGREYVAWFTPSVPISAGPWKFSGLPGLIVQIIDLQNDIYISLESLQFDDQMDLVTDDLEGEIITRKEFFECLSLEWVKYYNKNKANIARLQAEFPDLDISDNNLPIQRPATELEF